MQRAAGREVLRQRGDERRLDQPPLVMPLLVPGVGKEDVDAGQRGRRHHRAPAPRPRRAARCAGWSARVRRSGAAGRRRPGGCTSTPRKSVPGRRWAIAAVASPMPKPISSTTGASRPNSAAKSSGAAEKGSTKRGPRSCSARVWPLPMRPARSTKLRMARGACSEGGSFMAWQGQGAHCRSGAGTARACAGRQRSECVRGTGRGVPTAAMLAARGQAATSFIEPQRRTNRSALVAVRDHRRRRSQPEGDAVVARADRRHRFGAHRHRPDGRQLLREDDDSAALAWRRRQFGFLVYGSCTRRYRCCCSTACCCRSTSIGRSRWSA